MLCSWKPCLLACQKSIGRVPAIFCRAVFVCALYRTHLFPPLQLSKPLMPLAATTRASLTSWHPNLGKLTAICARSPPQQDTVIRLLRVCVSRCGCFLSRGKISPRASCCRHKTRNMAKLPKITNLPASLSIKGPQNISHRRPQKQRPSLIPDRSCYGVVDSSLPELVNFIGMCLYY